MQQVRAKIEILPPIRVILTIETEGACHTPIRTFRQLNQHCYTLVVAPMSQQPPYPIILDADDDGGGMDMSHEYRGILAISTVGIAMLGYGGSGGHCQLFQNV